MNKKVDRMVGFRNSTDCQQSSNLKRKQENAINCGGNFSRRRKKEKTGTAKHENLDPRMQYR